MNKGWQPSRHGLEHLIFPFILWICGTGRFDVDSFAVYVPTAETPGCSFGLRAKNWALRFLGVVVLRSVLAFRMAFPPSRNAGVLPSLCPTCRKSQQLKKVGCFVLHPLNSGTGFVELTSGCSVSGKAPPWG